MVVGFDVALDPEALVALDGAPDLLDSVAPGVLCGERGRRSWPACLVEEAEAAPCSRLERGSTSTAAIAAAASAIATSASARIRLRRRLARARTRRELPPCGKKGELLMSLLSSTRRIAQGPDDANRQDQEHDH